jgi:hypothetical protein
MSTPALPRLQGVKKIQYRLHGKNHPQIEQQVQFVEKAWNAAHQKLQGAGGLCGCGSKWPHLMNGVTVTLTDKAPYTARCWDDDRLFIHLKKFSQETDGGVGVLVHEFGHRVWFQCLDHEKRDIWKQSFKQAKSRPSPRWGNACGGVVSEYACTDELEDFAEAFRMLVYGKLDAYNMGRWRDVCACRDARCSVDGKSAKLLNAPAAAGRRRSDWWQP